MPRDYGYFGKGSTGYAHYMAAFNRSRRRGPGGGGGLGCFIVMLAVFVVLAIVSGLAQ